MCVIANVCEHGWMDADGSTNAVLSKASQSTKQKQTSLKEKLHIIEQVEKGNKQTDVADAFDLLKQTINVRLSRTRRQSSPSR